MNFKFCTMKINENCAFGFGKYFPIIKLLQSRNKLSSVPRISYWKSETALPFMSYGRKKYATIINLLRATNKFPSITLITYHASLIICICLSCFSLSAQTYNANPDLGNIKGNIKAKLKELYGPAMGK